MKTIKIYEEKRPDIIESPDLSQLRETVIEYMDAVESVESGGYIDEDFVHYVFEEAVGAFYGKDVWKYVNERQ